MSDTSIDMIRNIDFLYGFIYECANLINNLYEYNNYDYLAIKLCNKFVLPIINITKNEYIKEYNKHIKDTKNKHIICLYLINICSERCIELSQDEYSKIKEFINNNIDTIDSILAPMHEFFDLYKEFYNHCCRSCDYCSRKNYSKCREFCEGNNIILKKIVKSYFNVGYIKFFYLLQKNIDQIISKKLNLYNEDKLFL